MKQNICYTNAALVAAATPVPRLALARDESPSRKMDPKMEEMMKKAEAAATPGAAHKALDPLVGNWTAEVKCWMAPEGQITVTKATAKSTWVINGRFVQQEFSGEFMGKPFRGIGFTGYDNVRQKYNSVWMDDMSTTMFTSEGVADPDGKVLTFEGDYACAMTGEKHKVFRQIYRILGPDKHVFEMHDPTKGDNSKTLEITYTRAETSLTRTRE